MFPPSDLDLRTEGGMSAFLRVIRGPGLEIVLALFGLQRPLSAHALARITARDRLTVRRGLSELETLGVIARDPVGWTITGASRQMVFSALALPGGGEKITPLFIPSTLKSSVNESAVTGVEILTPVKFSPPHTDLVRALRHCGIYQPVRNELAALPGLTPAHVFSHYFQLRRQPGRRNLPGLLVNLLRNLDPVEPLPALPSDFCIACLHANGEHSPDCSEFISGGPELQPEGEMQPFDDGEEESHAVVDSPYWQPLLDSLSNSRQLSPAFEEHLEQVIGLDLVSDMARFTVESETSRLWLTDRKSVIERQFPGIIGRPVSVEFLGVCNG